MPENRVHYVQWDGGDVQSVDHDHFVEVLCETVAGKLYLRHGFTEVDESEARELHPALFGTPDKRVEAARTPAELVAEFERRQTLARMHRLTGGTE
ncbi:hypothetical protein SPF06_02505 [Sinomonas sp. JGH33]|uniref:Uncharacterized protein n=1 Tax=Sinomonas terricola TaxID=3110330 RepID=A0ABU5T247_9MICC|nr:hypothetical protein [Sinomonas sp. JGH33]MEA5453584.1 hypothetical protein [Sinomonas sp. JGH33]